MLKALTIENYALIDTLDIAWVEGFGIITGETGAGKSILLGALSLITGQRTDVSVLKDKSKKCIVEATFQLKNYNLAGFFEEIDLDYDDETCIRRIINPNGKSRAFVNDVPVTVQQLKQLSPKLIDIHSQHQNQVLQDGQFQLMVLDAFALPGKSMTKYQEAYRHYNKAQKELARLQQRAQESQEDLDYTRHQFSELEDAALSVDEQQQLEQELEALTHSEEIKSRLAQAATILESEEQSVLNQIQDCLTALRRIEDFYPKAKEFADRAESSYYDLKDIAEETEGLAETIEHDADRIAFINQRLGLFFQLQQKHRASSLDELIALREKYRQQLSEIDNFDEEIARLSKAVQAAQAKAQEIGETISAKRAKVIPSIQKNIKKQLGHLGMPNAVLKIDQQRAADFRPDGIDDINYLFSANKKGELQEIAKVASGGEISRVMLTLKALLSQKAALPTIIFDEIDTGVSGDIADKMGEIMRAMAENMQVMSITHLPQVAAKGHAHFKVYKQDTAASTQSNIKQLSADERTQEIAKMLSGSQLTKAALQNAEELLKQAAIQKSLF